MTTETLAAAGRCSSVLVNKEINCTNGLSFKGVRIRSELFFRVCKTKSRAAGVTKTKTLEN